MKAVWAYDFECDKPLAGMLAILNEAGPWTWMERDENALGPHICSVSFGGLRVRIYGRREGPRYTADLRMDDGCKADRASIDRVFRGSLHKLAAHDIAEGEYFY